MLLLLFAAAGLYLTLGDLHEALVLAASIVVVVAITVLQERKAERALEALRDLSSPRALVVRDGEPARIAGADVVRGDLAILGEGDRVPADAQLAPGAALMLDESLLTGESLAVEKGGGDAVFSGTLVVKGQARAEVFATGPRSELGRIGVSLATLESGKTALELETGAHRQAGRARRRSAVARHGGGALRAARRLDREPAWPVSPSRWRSCPRNSR
jgi:Ca2+-transporting ATPase